MSGNPRPRLILHIGTHKTGSTSLQDTLADAREPLLTTHGLLYPDTRRPPMPKLAKHCSVYVAAISPDPEVQARERATLLAEWADARARHGAHTMLISEEGLSQPNPRIPAFFAPLAAQFDIEVLCYLRRQDLFVESLFNQFVREQLKREARPLLGFLSAASTRARLDYHAMLSGWAALPARVQALDYDSPAVRASGLLGSLMTTLDMALPSLPERRSNPSPDMRLALLLNRMNRQGVDFELQPLMLAARAVARGGAPVMKHLLGAVQRQKLLAETAASNQRLATDFGVSFGSDLPEHEALDPLEDVDSAYQLRLLAQLSQQSRPA